MLFRVQADDTLIAAHLVGAVPDVVEHVDFYDAAVHETRDLTPGFGLYAAFGSDAYLLGSRSHGTAGTPAIVSQVVQGFDLDTGTVRWEIEGDTSVGRDVSFQTLTASA